MPNAAVLTAPSAGAATVMVSETAPSTTGMGASTPSGAWTFVMVKLYASPSAQARPVRVFWTLMAPSPSSAASVGS